MRSVKWPAPPAHDLVTLEARMDDLHRKMDQLLSRSTVAGCPMCGICGHHSKQQEATASQLSAQAKLLDSLERKVTEVRTALEELARGLEDRFCDRMSVPAIALQRRKSLPVRTSVDEVYVRLDVPREKIIQHAFNVPCGKGQTGALIEDSEGEALRGEGQPIRVNLTEVKGQHEPQPHKEVNRELSAVAPYLAASQSNHEPPCAAKMDGAIASSSQKSSKTTGVALPTSAGTSTKVTFPPKIVSKIATTKSSTSQNQPTAKTTQVAAPVKTSVSSLNTTALAGSTALVSNQKMPKTAVLAAHNTTTTTAAPTVVTAVSSNPPKFTVTKITAPPPSIHNVQKITLGLPVATSQSMGKSSSNSLSPVLPMTDSKWSNNTVTKTTVAGDQTPAPNHLPKTAGLTSALTTTAPTSVTSMSNNQPAVTVAPSHKPLKVTTTMGASGATSQNADKSSTNSQITKLPAAKSSTLSPPNTAGLMVPMATTAGSSLKHVYSCPESLQRFQGTGGKSDSSHTAAPPLVKPGAAVRPTSTVAGGIQIKISPAVAEQSTAQTKTPPKTCLKMIDDVPPQPAPFPHRCVSLRPSPPCDSFSIHTREVLGGGRFGKVHKCTDTKTGLRLAAKIISARSAKEREMALNEIQVMNQLSHSNILQLYDAFEAKNQVVLILEYVEGGELFERIVDESCPLTEVDAMVFVKQICEGVQYMHQMYVLHLDLKPENILCVNRSGHQIKIIDFGLARRYKPREKLRVSFGTPEFLAPEVVNFDFVSFPTDMWTLGVVTYMLLSGLSPFLGDDDSQTLNNVLTVNWYFDEDAFEHVSAEAKDFVSNLLIKERSGRLSATQCLKHPWLNNISEKAKRSNIILKSQVLLKKYMARRLWKKNYIAIAAANRFKKISSSGSLTSMGV
ncbi:myosin light chain kinase 2, skeletal/cardiac muscle [Colossoma macropomum]|uniref:myosin light chain kinase 2, skeletal/cardiac muscle n=1 Tax=Colossoma macropomum TaxID=42526 RepID=UPI001863C1ED|nr:myosin light chain kinase 2, skeletal/cardiac muscle [Colossoma macropomum]XP_036448382.1 myosin light chain kinase 2, skeletal/cardiac muscle [Colossoma macropomum]